MVEQHSYEHFPSHLAGGRFGNRSALQLVYLVSRPAYVSACGIGTEHTYAASMAMVDTVYGCGDSRGLGGSLARRLNGS